MSAQTESGSPGRAAALLRRAAEGYRRLFSLLAGLLPLLLGIVLIATAVVLPLWYLATHHRALYTALVLILAVGGFLFLSLRGILRRKEGRHLLRGSALTVLTLGAIYTGVRLVALGIYLPGVLLLLIAIFLTGLALAPKKKV